MKASFCHHVHLFCKDLEPMIDFWTKAFGVSVIKRRMYGNASGAIIDLGGGVNLALKETDCLAQGSAVTVGGVDHIGMQVESLDAALAHMLTLPGVTLAKEPVCAGGNRFAFVKGPEGISVELLEPCPEA